MTLEEHIRELVAEEINGYPMHPEKWKPVELQVRSALLNIVRAEINGYIDDLDRAFADVREKRKTIRQEESPKTELFTPESKPQVGPK